MPPWPPQESCTPHGKWALISVVRAGFLTAVFVTPSTTPGRNVGQGSQECTQFILTPTRLDTLTLTPNMMPIVSRVRSEPTPSKFSDNNRFIVITTACYV